MRFVGIDLGVRSLHIASINEAGFRDDAAAETIEVPKKPYRQQELQLLGDAANSFIDSNSVVVIEKPPYVNNYQTLIALSEVSGAILGMLNHPAHLVDVASWKKEVVGKGNADKDFVSNWLSSTYPEYFAVCGRQDHADAFCIALYGRIVLEGQ